MRRSLYTTFIACGLLSAGMVQAQTNSCSQNTVVGTYVLSYQGTAIIPPPGATTPVPIPAAGVGIVSIDHLGAITSTAYQTIGGQATLGSMPGSIVVNPDCTGTVYWTGDGAATVNILNDGAEINSMMVKFGMPMVVYGTWKRITPNAVLPACSLDTIAGRYAYRIYGSVITIPQGSTQAIAVPEAHIGTGSIANDGTTAATGTTSSAGTVIGYQLAGNTTVNPDCTFTMALNLSVGGTKLGSTSVWGIALPGHNQLIGIPTTGATGVPVEIGIWTRLSPMPEEMF